MRKTTRSSLLAKLDSTIDKSGDCWLWTGGKDSDGYAIVRSGLSSRRVSRVIWMLAHGPLENGIIVCHHCDNPACCRLEHLFCGTHGDNARDRKAKGRNNSQRGTDRYNAVLTPEKVRRIRELRQAGEELQAIADRMGVNKTSIWAVVHRKTWKHVT